MDQRLIFVVVGGIGAATIAMFFIFGQGALRTIVPLQSSAATNSTVKDLAIVVKNVTVSRQDNDTAKVLVVFGVTNPNPATALLENVHYELSVGGDRMTSGDSGEVLEGFLGSQATAITIVPMGTVVIKDEQVSTRNNLTGSNWDSMVRGTAKFEIGGWYAVRTTADLQTNYNEKDFQLQYPAH